MLILTVSNRSPRYVGNSSSIQILADREIDTHHALRTYLQDHQAHEKLAVQLQSPTANQPIKGDEGEVKEKQVRIL
jgi:hypothetical protein